MPKKILLVEDEAIIAMNEARMLQKHGYEVVTVYSGEKAVEAVDSDPEISLILMDIDLGKGMDGTEAAERILERHDSPIAFLSSHTEPEVVEKTEGITSYGYILKNSGETVLLASIRMAFRLYEAHRELKNQKDNLNSALVKYEQTSEELRDSEEKFRTMMNQSIDMIFLHDLEGHIVDVNQTGIEQTGYSKEQLLSMAISDLDPDYREREKGGRFWRNIGYNQPYPFEAHLRRNDDSMFPIEIFVSKLLLNGSTYIMTCSRNISDRKQAEHEIKSREENLRTTLNSIGDAVISTDIDGKIVQMNPVAESLCGWSIYEAKGKALKEVFHIIHADTREMVDNPVEEVLQRGEIVSLGNHTILISKNGSEYQIADSAAPIKDEEGNVNGVVLVFRDVTEEYEKERQLQESEKKHKALFNSIRDALIVVNQKRQITNCNSAFTELFGYTFSEVQGNTTDMLFASKEEYQQLGRIMQDMDSDPSFIYQTRYCRKSGEVFWGEKKIQHLWDNTGEHEGFIGLIRDITERKQTEEALKREDFFLSSVLDNIKEAIIICNEKGEIIRFNESARKLHNLPEKQIPAEQWAEYYDLYYPDTHTLLATEDIPLYRALQGEAVINLEIFVKPQNSPSRILSCSGNQLVDNNGKKIGAVIAMHDITEQKTSENLIKEYADKLELTMKGANIAWWEMDIKSGAAVFNKEKTDILGYNQEDFKHYRDFTNLLHPDDYEKAMDAMRLCIKGEKERYDVEYRIKTASSEYRWFHDYGNITTRDANGAPLKVAGIVIDITKLKEAEQALQEANLRLTTIIDSIDVTIYISDLETYEILFINEHGRRASGDIAGQKCYQAIQGRDEPCSFCTNNRLVDKDGNPTGVIVWDHYNTVIGRWFNCRDSVVQWFDGRIVRIEVATDITEQKQQEENLKEALQEKDFLMRELNHRVKNNLALVSSLISLKDSETEEDLSNLKHRIEVIKLVHEKLHQRSDIERIEVHEYLQELLESIFASTNKGDVELVNNSADVSIPTKTAIPLGLIVNEIATNAIKYGFTSDKKSRFIVTLLEEKKSGQYILSLSNTGNPFPEEIGLENSETMGLQLISTLVAQLNGTIELQKKPNPVFSIRFPVED